MSLKLAPGTIRQGSDSPFPVLCSNYTSMRSVRSSCHLQWMHIPVGLLTIVHLFWSETCKELPMLTLDQNEVTVKTRVEAFTLADVSQLRPCSSLPLWRKTGFLHPQVKCWKLPLLYLNEPVHCRIKQDSRSCSVNVSDDEIKVTFICLHHL